jgi:thiol-disulfide isomerase/thioredoxin
VKRIATALVAALLVSGTAAAGVGTVTPESFRAELASMRGKVVLLNVWATWCGPCLKEIPDLVAIEKELAARGFVLVGISVDEAADLARVEDFRQKYFPEFRTVVRETSDMDAVVSVIDPAWNEIVPTSYLIGRDGRVIERIQGKKTREEFRKAALAALGR